MKEKIVIVGAGGHAKTIVDTLERLDTFEIAGYISKENVGSDIYRGYKIIGRDEDLKEIYKSGVVNAIIAVGFMGRSTLRQKLYEDLKQIGYKLPAIVDPTAIIATDVVIDEGTYIGRNVVVNADAKIGKCCILNTSCVVDHENHIGNFTHISVQAVCCGKVHIGENCMLGANSTVIQNITVGDNTVIGAGALIIKDIGCNLIVKDKKNKIIT